jgi:LPS-assembly lipoprotein
MKFCLVSIENRGLPKRSLVWAFLVLGLLTGCGFHLRGNLAFDFSSIAITPYPGSAVAQELRRSLGSAVNVLKPHDPLTQAQLVMNVLSEQREKTVVGVNASGQVREFQLRNRVKFSLTTPQGREIWAENEILQQRDISYNESAALAKEAEEILLYRDMQTDIVQQIMRRLATVQLF